MMHKPFSDNADNILPFILPNTIGAEIGVWKGYSSKKFLKKNLKKLYLVDPWSIEAFLLSPELDYISKYAKTVGSNNPADFQKLYDSIYLNLAEEMKEYPEAEIFRQCSVDWFDSFTGEKLDWIYIDGDHTYTGVKSDLENSLNVMKEDGIIFGDDFHQPEVKTAAYEFIAEHDLTIEVHNKFNFSINLKRVS